MKHRTLLGIILFLLSFCVLTGCESEMFNEHISDPIALSGNLTYYAELDRNTLEELCEDKHIEVTGAVSSTGYTIIYLGDTLRDGIRFSCTFSDRTDALKSLNTGDIITVHGVCTSVIGNHIYLDGCQLSAIPEATTPTTAPHSIPNSLPDETLPTEPTQPTTVPHSVPNSLPDEALSTEPTQSTTAPQTEPPTTAAPHVHSFSNATCTSPRTCSCGATEGSANGHNWKPATCSEPKICTVCGTSSGLTAGHNFANGQCTSCGKADPDYTHETMVWIPTNGGTKYHTHAGCSNMVDPEQVTQSEAEALGFTPCKRCH